MRCEELMKRKPECIKETDPVQHAAARMRAENIGFLPVCSAAGKPIGTLTDRDLAIRVLANGKSGTARVSEVMTREVISCRPGDDLSQAEQLMGQHRKSRIMVVDDAGKLVGVISLSDVAQADSGGAAQTIKQVSQREAHA
jgi:CBS domain-containing protein